MQGEGSTISVFLGRDPALALLGMDLDALRAAIAEHGAMAWVQTLRARFLGRSATIRGRLLVDERSSMFMAEALEPVDEDGAMMATEARAQWEVA